MNRTIYSFVAAAFLAAPLAAGAEAPTEEQVEKLYMKRCDNCHGIDGKAQTKMGRKHEIDSFVDAAWQARHSDDELRDAITNGIPDTKMKAYKKKLSPEEIDALVKYVRKFNPGTSAQNVKADGEQKAEKDEAKE